MPHVVIDGRALCGPFTGDRTYWRGLLAGLRRAAPAYTFTVVTREPTGEDCAHLREHLDFRVVTAPNDRIWTFRALPAAARALGADLVHTQYTAPPPFLCRCPVVTTVHDISFHLYPQWFPRYHRTLMNLTVPLTMRFSTAVITVSSSSRRDILKSYHLPEDKVIAVENGIDISYRPPRNDLEKASDNEFARQHYGITSRFILAVGVLQPRKNLAVLAEAFGELCARGDDETVLAFTGKAGWATGRDDLRRVAAAHGGESAASRVIFTGYVPDHALERLFRACAVFAYPSLFEGFGLPPLEAMASGAPTLSADAPAMNELLQEGAILISPHSSSAWADSIQQVLQDNKLAERLTQAGPPVAARFTWERAARETVDVYAQALRNNQ